MDIVYAPIPFKNDVRSIAREKVVIGNTAAQCLGIREFELDFDTLWLKSTPLIRHHDNLATHIHEERLANADDNYYHKACYSIDLFGVVYRRQIRDIIHKRTGRDVDEDED
jgi:hypothetical protein